MSFFILSIRYRDGQDWQDQLEKRFDSGADAQAEAKRLNDYNGQWGYQTRYRVRKVVDTDSDNFYVREAALNHTPIPWETGYCMGDRAYMFPHIDPDDPKKVRFFRCVEHAIEQRYTSMKMSRFLSEYECMDTDEVATILVKAGIYSDDTEFGVTQDPDLIVDIYQNGPSSCMNDPDEYELPDPHPAIVYSKGDLAVAYIKRGDDYTARAVVYPEEKLYYSMYGHSELLTQHLRDEGYIEDPKGGRGFDGAKVAAIEHGCNYFLMPYIDAIGQATLVREGDERYFRLDYSGGEYDVRTTEGYTYYCED